MTEPAVVSPATGRSRWQLTAQLLVLVAVVVPRFLAYSSAGGLWRDEVHSVNMATLPADDAFFVLTNDSFPMLWAIVLRSWIAAFGSGDESVRLLGLLIGLAVIPAFWWTARQFGMAFPWWSMVLLGLDPTMVVFGGEVRGYGLGIVTFLILIGMAWRTLKQPSAGRWIGLTAASLLAVQSSFTNCFLLAATFIACGIVALRRGRIRDCMCFASIGVLAAASMAPYAMYVFPRFSVLARPFIDPVSPWAPTIVFRQMFLWGGETRKLIWLVVGLVGSLGILHRLNPWIGQKSDQTDDDQDLALFLPLFFWIGTAGFWGYMGLLRVYTAYWYHLPWLAVLAVTTDLQMELLTRQRPRRQVLNACLATLACAFVLFQIAPRVQLRLTTLDLIAHDLNESVRAGDLVVAGPWFAGVPFERYYDGPADWIKVPNIDGRYRFLEELNERLAIQPPPMAIEKELRKIDAVLASGGRVWWIGFGPLTLLPPDEAAAMVNGERGPQPDWNGNNYTSYWDQLAISHMQSFGVTAREWTAPRPHGVNHHENPSVYLIECGQVRQPPSQDSPSRREAPEGPIAIKPERQPR